MIFLKVFPIRHRDRMKTQPSFLSKDSREIIKIEPKKVFVDSTHDTRIYYGHGKFSS